VHIIVVGVIAADTHAKNSKHTDNAHPWMVKIKTWLSTQTAVLDRTKEETLRMEVRTMNGKRVEINLFFC